MPSELVLQDLGCNYIRINCIRINIGKSDLGRSAGRAKGRERGCSFRQTLGAGGSRESPASPGGKFWEQVKGGRLGGGQG